MLSAIQPATKIIMQTRVFFNLKAVNNKFAVNMGHRLTKIAKFTQHLNLTKAHVFRLAAMEIMITLTWINYINANRRTKRQSQPPKLKKLS